MVNLSSITSSTKSAGIQNGPQKVSYPQNKTGGNKAA
jgi:hypothetical protein